MENNVEKLADYLCRALAAESESVTAPCHLQRHTTQIDGSAEVRLTLSQWRFTNGVLLQQEQEAELQPADAAEDHCPAGLIRWRVLDDAGLIIQPREKTFHNLCQQAFWLKMARQDGV
ncbi:hypothetical protein [Edwardsiella tarda]|uniref:hypothetical protein n=1 Tax=Edwardsiella tarda TaxID=636 RepID=UPI00351C3C65